MTKMKDMGIDTVTEDLDHAMSLEDAKSVNSDDALLMSMGKKPELKRGMVYPSPASPSARC
jgi:hypothetical protein